jgi:hypothetical protein
MADTCLAWLSRPIGPRAGLKINASKSHFCCDELEYLGYLINRRGVRPTVRKVEAIMKIDAPKTRKQLRSFIGMEGMVNYS